MYCIVLYVLNNANSYYQPNILRFEQSYRTEHDTCPALIQYQYILSIGLAQIHTVSHVLYSTCQTVRICTGPVEHVIQHHNYLPCYYSMTTTEYTFKAHTVLYKNNIQYSTPLLAFHPMHHSRFYWFYCIPTVIVSWQRVVVPKLTYCTVSYSMIQRGALHSAVTALQYVLFKTACSKYLPERSTRSTSYSTLCNSWKNITVGQSCGHEQMLCLMAPQLISLLYAYES